MVAMAVVAGRRCEILLLEHGDFPHGHSVSSGRTDRSAEGCPSADVVASHLARHRSGSARQVSATWVG